MQYRIAVLAVFILLSFGSITHGQPGMTPQPIVWPIENILQETPVWCWAAVAQQIILYKVGPHNTPSQCAMVALAKGLHPQMCCPPGNNPQQCVTPGGIQQIQWLMAHFGMAYSQYAPPASPMHLYHALRQKKVIILQLATGQQTAHVVVLRGMTFQPSPMGPIPYLIINDPMSQFTAPVPFAQIAPIWMSAIVVQL